MRKLAVSVVALIFCVFAFTPSAVAQGEDTSGPEVVELTLERAVQRALGFNPVLEQKQLEVEQTDDARVSARGIWYVQWSPEAGAGIYAAESTRFAYEQARKERDRQRDVVALEVTKSYYDVLTAQEKLAAQEQSYVHLEAEVRAARAMFTVGMMSRLARDEVEARLKTATAEVAAARAELDNAWLALNQLVRFSAGERPVLVDQVPFEPVTLELRVYEARAFSDNPSLEMVRAAADYMNRVENYTVSGKVPVTTTDAKQAELELDSARDGVCKLVHHLYHGAKTLEATHAAAAQGLVVAEETLRITRLQFEVGLVTQTAVLAAEAAVASTRQQLLDLAAQHAHLKLALDKPWAYLSTGN